MSGVLKGGGTPKQGIMNRLLTTIVSSSLFLSVHVSAGEFSADSMALRSHVLFLSTIHPSRSVDNLSSLNRSAQYIEDQFRLYTHRIDIQKYDVSSGEVKNIIASFGPEDGSRIIVGAHYDVAGDQPGADDNASGIAGLIELARILSKDTNKLDKRIDVVAYTLEEPPFFRTEKMGSFIHAKSLNTQGVKIDLMISLEMIGYYSDEENSQTYPIGFMKLVYPTIGNFIAVVSNFNSHCIASDFAEEMEQNCSLDIERLTAPESVAGVDFSDHLNYWHFGYKAFMITDTAFLRNKHYHQQSDTPERLDYHNMAEIVNGIHYALNHFHAKNKKFK
jgi:Zn-dependent M28 family amino/carboxypeptidase